jgi:hypothetical protein
MLKSYLYWKLRRKTQSNNVYSVTRPEVVLPTYMASAFGLDKGVSLADIIGTDGLDEKNETYFDNKPKVGARFITLTVVRFTILLG